MSERWVRGQMWNKSIGYVNMDKIIFMHITEIDGGWYTELHSGSQAAFATEDKEGEKQAIQKVYAIHFANKPEHFLPPDHPKYKSEDIK